MKFRLQILKLILNNLPLFFKIFISVLRRPHNTRPPISIKTMFIQWVLGFNRTSYWPTHHSSVISSPHKILIGSGHAPGASPGCYIQGSGTIRIGDYTVIAPNVGIISSNHDIHNINKNCVDKVVIGSYCWLGM